jgi:hypothetical protein
MLRSARLFWLIRYARHQQEHLLGHQTNEKYIQRFS